MDQEPEDYSEPGDQPRRPPFWRITVFAAAVIWGIVFVVWFVETFVHKIRE